MVHKLKFTKFIIPVSVSLAAFIWGYRGNLWLGKIDPSAGSRQLSPSEEIENNPKNAQKTESSAASRSSFIASGPTPSEPMPGGPPLKARELPISIGDNNEEYAPEDDVQNPDGDSTEIESDPEEDQALSEDEPGADNSENEEVDSNSNEGDLEGDETADTAETKPVKP